MSDKTGFLEESPGVRSMSRLAIGACLVLAGAVVALLWCYVWWTRAAASAGVIAAIVAALTALVLNGAVALAKRNGGDTNNTETTP